MLADIMRDNYCILYNTTKLKCLWAHADVVDYTHNICVAAHSNMTFNFSTHCHWETNKLTHSNWTHNKHTTLFSLQTPKPVRFLFHTAFTSTVFKHKNSNAAVLSLASAPPWLPCQTWAQQTFLTIGDKIKDTKVKQLLQPQQPQIIMLCARCCCKLWFVRSKATHTRVDGLVRLQNYKVMSESWLNKIKDATFLNKMRKAQDTTFIKHCALKSNILDMIHVLINVLSCLHHLLY